MDEPLMTLSEVAQYLRVSKATLFRWIKAGTFPAFRLGPSGAFRIRSEDVTAYINNRG